MTDTEKLRAAIRDSGYKYSHIANELGLSTYGLQRKIDNLSEFRASEIARLVKILKLSEQESQQIFFAGW